MQMNQEQRATEFAVFCIENTATRLQCTGFEVFQELQRTDGIKRFLVHLHVSFFLFFSRGNGKDNGYCWFSQEVGGKDVLRVVLYVIKSIFVSLQEYSCWQMKLLLQG